MARTEIITMSMREIDRLKTVQAVVNGDLKPDGRGGPTELDATPSAPVGDPVSN